MVSLLFMIYLYIIHSYSCCSARCRADLTRSNSPGCTCGVPVQKEESQQRHSLHHTRFQCSWWISCLNYEKQVIFFKKSSVSWE